MGVFIINPYVGFEDYQSENNVPKTAGPKKILVVVGGISGMQFSIIAAKRGNQVMIPSMNFTQCLRISWQYVPARGKWDWIFMNSCWKRDMKPIGLETMKGFLIS